MFKQNVIHCTRIFSLHSSLVFSLLISLSMSLSLPNVAEAETIRLYIQEYAPFTHTDPKTNQIKGSLTDKVVEIMRRAKETPILISTSLARGYQAALTENNTCLFGFRRTAEREPLFKWVGPLTADAWVLYAKKPDSRNLKNFEEAKTYSIGTYKNAATGLELKDQGYKMEFASKDEDNPRLLINGRIDYWIVSEQHGMSIAQQQGYWDDIERAIKWRNIELYMLCNAKIDQHRIDKFNAINKEIDNDGTMDKYQRKYGAR
ncbi:polar amino acid transport system substrate-binding protein [Undibacterium sp. GrIS 1.8]|uniref:substrate-binding periplasmic protein n=1 Tax=unclassified Undibacterium TaxID=2630295 RepID=UPI00339A17A0